MQFVRQDLLLPLREGPVFRSAWIIFQYRNVISLILHLGIKRGSGYTPTSLMILRIMYLQSGKTYKLAS